MKIFKQQVRMLLRQKFSTTINIIGMSLGFSCCIIIGLFIKTEISYDDFHDKKDRIYRLLSYNDENGQYSANVTYRLGPDCAEFINGVEKTARLYNLWSPNVISFDKTAVKANNLFYTDPSILDIFSFDFIAGDKSNALRAPGSVILTKTVSEKYFKEENPLGKVIVLDNMTNLTITGVVRDFPVNSHFHFEYLVYDPARLESWGDWIKQAWDLNSFNTYVLLSKDLPLNQFTNEFKSYAQKYVDEKNRKNILNTKLQSLSEIHLYSKSISDNPEPTGDISTVVIFLSIAVCILVIACINYISLSISIVRKRVRDVGVRKIFGARSSSIKALYIAESIIICMISLVFAIFFVGLLQPVLDQFIKLQFDIKDLSGIPFLLISSATALSISVLSGLYISNNVLKYSALSLIRGHELSKFAGISKSYIYLSVQFTISIILIIGSGFIFKQMRFIQQSDLGYNADRIITIPVDKTFETARSLRDRLLRNPQIADITFASSFPPNKYHFSSAGSPDDPEIGSIQTKYFFVDFNFIDFMKIKIIEGRNFSVDFSTDEDQGAIINRAFAEKMGWKSSVGKHIKNGWNQKDQIVIGVVENFYFKSFHEKIEPVVLNISLKQDLYKMGVKLSSNDFESSLSFIKSEWESTNPGNPFEYQFLDQAVQLNYANDRRQAHIILLFSFLAMIITCLGLIATSVFLTKLRTKEIGIRKINGAHVSEVILMLTKDFFVWVAIAFIIAIPVSYYSINKWLENFAYKTDLSWWIFVLSGIIAIGIAMLTVCLQSWRGATRNPVDALRYE
ncbi:MAG: ABC transporter permease [Bacteroidales bacterium]|nr:ABC transporter permease [Bacteroidales bacterium]